MTGTLPDKPSELLKLALHDVELCDADPDWRWDMDKWLAKSYNGVCVGCVAGAVMRQTFKLNSGTPDYLIQAGYKLDAIDSFRVGDIGPALKFMDIGLPASIPEFYQDANLDNLSYDDLPEWKRHMWRIVEMLETEGL